ncbi:unnamed protein product [Lampetra fluviatilis]
MESPGPAAAAAAAARRRRRPSLRRSFSDRVRTATTRAWRSLLCGSPSSSSYKATEIEAKEACDWLKAAGFPQYAQLYEDSQFPIDIAAVERDHDFLDWDSFESVCRRLNALNKWASMRIDTTPLRKRGDDSDEDEQCALSGKWTFERSSRRWSRVDQPGTPGVPGVPIAAPVAGGRASSPNEPLKTLSALTEGGGGGGKAAADAAPGRTARPERPAGGAAFGSDPGGLAAEPGPSPAKSSSSSTARERDGRAMRDLGASTLPAALAREVLGRKLPDASPADEKHRSKAKSLLKRVENLRLRKQQQQRRKATALPSRKEPLVISGPVPRPAPDRAAVRSGLADAAGDGGGRLAGVVGGGRDERGDDSSLAAIAERNRRNGAASRSQESLAFHLPRDHKPGTFPRALSSESLSPTTGRGPGGAGGRFGDGGFLLGGRLGDARYDGDDDGDGTDASRESLPAAGSRHVRHPFQHQHGYGSLGGQHRRCHRQRSSSFGSTGSRLSLYDNVPCGGGSSSAGDLSDADAGGAGGGAFSGFDALLSHVADMQRSVDSWTRQVWSELEVTESAGGGRRLSEAQSGSAPSLGSAAEGAEPGGESAGRGDDAAAAAPVPAAESLPELDDSEGGAARERRDSGVGASLTRPNRRARLRWPSFQRSHCPRHAGSAALQLHAQSAAQLNLLQRFALLRLTALIEKHSPTNKHGWNWAVPRFMKRARAPDYRDKAVFGVPLLVNAQRTGQPLPQSIQQAMRHLRNHGRDQVGLFRKCGVKSRIEALRQMNEASPEGVDYGEQSAYDVADLLKQYFRDLPEPLLTSKLSDTFLLIHQFVPKEQRLAAVQAAVLLLPDESREALQSLLFLLSDVAACVADNQMTPGNLAICLAPSIFHLNTAKREHSSPRSIQRKHSMGKPDHKDLTENLAATQGLTHMISECKKLFQVPPEMLKQSQGSGEPTARPRRSSLPSSPSSSASSTSSSASSSSSSSCEGDADREAEGSRRWPAALAPAPCDPAELRAALDERIEGLLKEARDKFRGWTAAQSHEHHVELSYRKVEDGAPLRAWRASVEVEATVAEVVQRVLHERALWDDGLVQERRAVAAAGRTDLVQFATDAMAPQPTRDHVLIRTWRSDLPRGASAVAAVSVPAPEAPLAGGVRAHTYDARYLVEPLAPARCRLTYVCRIDMRGRTSDWYVKVFGHLCASEVARIRDSFQAHASDGPETKI